MDLLKTSQLPVESLLQPSEPAAVEVLNPRGPSTIFFICDHASNRLPMALGDLGLPQFYFESHIGWDIGAAELARRLAARFSATLVLSGYSRLVIDCNRPDTSDGLIPEASAGIEIPGNQGLSASDKAARRQTFFDPYHNTIAGLLDRRQKEGQPTALISMHSFTPNYPGERRPWHVDFAYHRDRRLAGLLLDSDISAELVVGDNLPYKVEDDSDYSIPVHGEKRGLPHVLVEIRQDTLSDRAGIDRWAERFSGTLTQLMPKITQIASSSLSNRGHLRS